MTNFTCGHCQTTSAQWCRLTHRNGEIALAGEGVSNPKRARSAIIRAMIDVLEDEGYVVTKPEEAGR